MKMGQYGHQAREPEGEANMCDKKKGRNYCLRPSKFYSFWFARDRARKTPTSDPEHPSEQPASTAAWMSIRVLSQHGADITRRIKYNTHASDSLVQRHLVVSCLTGEGATVRERCNSVGASIGISQAECGHAACVCAYTEEKRAHTEPTRMVMYYQ
ncbi:hypothetical protein evm_003942 [Chilo suppressalis]|nr:hypothetical protein evm_003942 [Chilo suppressalis]